MKQFVRFATENRAIYGQVTPEGVYSIDQTPFDNYSRADFVGDVEELDLLAPVTPSKIIAVGLNYRDHAEEVGKEVPEEPVIFLKPSTSVTGWGQPIIHPEDTERLDYEGELAVIIGKQIFRADAVNSRRAIFGYTCANDVTARDLQRKDGQWTRAKSFDTFCPIGPFINYDVDLGNREITTRLNGEVKQKSNMGEMAFDPEYLVWFCSRIMTLNPGDVIITGTPAGIGKMVPGDRVEVEIAGFGTLKNHVIDADS